MKKHFQSHHFYHEEVYSKSSSSPGSFSAIAREFPDKVASMFAMIELFFGIGEKIQSLLKIVRSCFQNPPPPLNTTCWKCSRGYTKENKVKLGQLLQAFCGEFMLKGLQWWGGHKMKNCLLKAINIQPYPGEIVGPVVGGALYEIGGFTLPFAVMGSILALSSVFIYFVLPDTPQPPPSEAVE